MESVRGKKIFVGLSGGVDSAVSAALLKKSGAAVTGVFIKGWYPPGMPCSWSDDRRDAMRVAARLGIPFLTLDASAEYKKGVIDYLLYEYENGRTPNPDIMCNREVKFGAFYAYARKAGADFIATGHYARSTIDTDLQAHLMRGIDASKDQSYFLWAIPKDALAHTLFPVGDVPKNRVRELALAFNLPVADKKDSQGICFLGSISIDEFLRAELSPEQGSAIDESGVPIGTHDGAVLYTLGERISLHDAATGPWYVVAKQLKENIVVVSKSASTPAACSEISLRDTNFFISIPEKNGTKELTAQYRYHGPLITGTYDFNTDRFTPKYALREPIASGQSLVLYSVDECIGGGIIA